LPATSPTAPCDQLPSQLSPDGYLFMDTEHRGLGREAQACGVSLCDEQDGCWYWPFGHAEGTQLEPNNVRNFLRDKLRGRDLVFRAAKNDLEVMRRWGLDLEKLGVRPHEVQHAAALLDDKRRHFDLETLMQDELGRGKVKLPFSPETIWEQPPHLVAEYAREDARGTRDLWQKYIPSINKNGLDKVLKLEDELIYCVLSMERAGILLDIPLLEQWDREILDEYNKRIWKLYELTGVRVNPNSGDDLSRLFKKLDLPIYYTAKNNPNFDEKILEEAAGEWTGRGARHFQVKNVAVQLAREARQLDSLRTKYTMKYLRGNLGGIIYYQLHQLRADEGGTITGRFASSGIQVNGVKMGCNIQQVTKPSKQDTITLPWIVRQLFLPPRGRLFLDADASQIEFRLFAHYSNVPAPHSTRLIEAYNANPNIDFHQLVTDNILKGAMARVFAKNWNFRKLYGGGVAKSMAMTGLEFEECERMDREYDDLFPEASRVLRYCSDIAERRRYVKTFLGRRRRFGMEDTRFYSALNCILQGGAAELMKLKLLRLYNERKTLDLTLRATVHDEAIGDLSPDPVFLQRVKECFNEQEWPLRVPITWEVDTGQNWYDAGGEMKKVEERIAFELAQPERSLANLTLANHRRDKEHGG
jgi:DNA polymerase-1